jgi:hypothetical protein
MKSLKVLIQFQIKVMSLNITLRVLSSNYLITSYCSFKYMHYA